MQETIAAAKPDFIIETGAFTGGATLLYATILEKITAKGKISLANR
jgi:cephalosporin hydroxylase